MRNPSPLDPLDILSKENLRNAWHKLNTNIDSYGLGKDDDMPGTSDNQRPNIDDIFNSLHNKNYKFSNYKGVYIQKKGRNSYRFLQIPTIRDRIVLKTLSTALEQIFHNEIKKYKAVSFGFQKGVSGVKEASEQIQTYLAEGYLHVFESDIKDFFPSINREKLLQEHIYPKVNHPYIQELIKKGISQKTTIEKPPKGVSPINEERGLPQGNNLSPLLSNIYLSSFDKLFSNKKDVKLVRYADDFIIMVKNSNQLNTIRNEVVQCLNLLSLKINEEKTSVKNFQEDGESLTFLGITHTTVKMTPSKEAVEKFISKIETLKKQLVEENKWDVLNLLQTLKYKIDGWEAAFHFSDYEAAAARIDKKVNQILFGNLKNLNWNLSSKSKYANNSCTYICKRARANSGVPELVSKYKERKNTPNT